MKKIEKKNPIIGILAIQGNFFKHEQLLNRLNINTILIKKIEELDKCQGLIIPGGESTTIWKLCKNYGFIEALKDYHKKGNGIYGTCAGLILLAKKVYSPSQESLGLIDIETERNGFGRQINSFITDLKMPFLDNKKFESVFIRAPRIISIGKNVEVLATYNNEPVLARENNVLVSTFHPEMTNDIRLHSYFINKVINN